MTIEWEKTEAGEPSGYVSSDGAFSVLKNDRGAFVARERGEIIGARDTAMQARKLCEARADDRAGIARKSVLAEREALLKRLLTMVATSREGLHVESWSEANAATAREWLAEIEKEG